MTISNDVKAAIQKNLPSMVADELAAFIEEGQQAISQAARLAELYKESQAKVAELSALDRRVDIIEQREYEIQDKDAALKLREEVLKVKEEQTALRLADLKELTMAVFRNPTVRQTSNVGHAVPQPNGGYPFITTTTDTKTTEII